MAPDLVEQLDLLDAALHARPACLQRSAVLHCCGMMRCATNYEWREKTAGAPPPGAAG
jgi:hypothetical protein